MTATEIELRVDAWICHRSEAGWFADADRRFLRDQWRDVAHRHGPDSEAARGVLLGLLREACGCHDVYVAHESNRMGDFGWIAVSPRLHGRMFHSVHSETETAALIDGLGALL